MVYKSQEANVGKVGLKIWLNVPDEYVDELYQFKSSRWFWVLRKVEFNFRFTSMFHIICAIILINSIKITLN